MLYLTDISTASKMLNLNNPILSDWRECSVGYATPSYSASRRDATLKNSCF